DPLEQVVRQVIGEVEIRQVLADLCDALPPLVDRLLDQRVDDALANLREDGLVADFLLEHVPPDDSPRQDLLAHAFADAPCEDRVLAELQVKLEHFRHTLVNSHGGCSLATWP